MLVSGPLLVNFLDYPYNPGAGTLRPTAMEQSLPQMDQLTTTLHLDLPDLCDANGVPHPPG